MWNKTRPKETKLQWVVAGMVIAMAVFSLICADTAGADVHAPVITIHAARFAFTPSEITLKQGQTVELLFIADDVPHSITIKGLGIDIELPKQKARKVIVTPAAVGDFDGECSRYCGNGHHNMRFVVHVQP